MRLKQRRLRYFILDVVQSNVVRKNVIVTQYRKKKIGSLGCIVGFLFLFLFVKLP